MVWRRSSAMAAFLQQLAQVFRELPAELFAPTADFAGSTRGTLVVDRAAPKG
jgi:LysR family hydrogen peroxide-inducible transcriptional activator